MTRIIAVSLSKGGVGKTTTAVNLAACLSLNDRRVLLIDTDTQGQSGTALGIEQGPGLAEYVLNETDAAGAIVEARPGLYLMRGSYRLAGVKEVISSKQINPQLTLARALEPINPHFDYVIIDTSPGWDSLQINVLFYGRELLCPVNLEMMSIDGLLGFLDRVREVQVDNPGLIVRYLLPTELDRRVKQTSEILGQLQDTFGATICDPIRYNVRLSEAPAHGQHIFEYSPKSNGAADYQALTQRILADE